MYRSLATLFWFLRQFCLPNPFDVLGNDILIDYIGIQIFIPPDILNGIAGAILYPFTYAMVGLCYERKSCPAFGSCLYMLFYCVHTGFIYIILYFYPTKWVMILVSILCILFSYLLTLLVNKIKHVLR